MSLPLPLLKYDVPEQFLTGGLTGAMPPNSGSIFHTEGQYLYQCARDWGGPVLQLGVARGVSSRYIMLGLHANDAAKENRLVDVDIIEYWHKNHVAVWLDENAPSCRRFFVNHDSGSCDDLPLVKRFNYRWCFIDGDHRYPGAMADIECAVRLGIKTLVFHDTSPQSQQVGYNEPRRAVLEFLEKNPEWRVVRDCTDLCGLMTIERD